ncbi:hypothetical protein [Bdellovibrio sp. GT3]|uniref:hypothetical protein n=1 Tax=Bdellovibrio sp. GT3 TaxID=3136282 RepID=UPI0030F1EC00
MKKGLIVLGIALVAAFLFREGQREGVSTLAKNTGKSLDVQTEKLSNLDNNTNVSSPSQQAVAVQPSPSQTVAEEDPAQMQSREIVPRELARPQAHPKFAKPDSGDLKGNYLFRSSSWKVWTGVRAVPKVNVEPGDEVVGLAAGYAIIRDSAMLGDERNFSLAAPMVVFNENAGKVGVIPGRVEVKLKDARQIGQIEKEYGLNVVNRFPHLRLFFVTSSLQNFDLSKLVTFLKKDKRVEKADLEIVSGNRVKN